jgi:CheY-specific phosphatase CheX
MLIEEMNEKAMKVIINILNECSYIFADPVSEEEIPPLNELNLKGVFLEYSGHKSGHVSLLANDEFLKYAAANMLGIDENSNDAIEKGFDSIKEILNMVVGNLLTEIYGCDPVFDIGIPRVLESLDEVNDSQEKDRLFFNADDHILVFEFNIK